MQIFRVVISCVCLTAALGAVDPTPARAGTEYYAKDYSYLFGMQGFNDALLKMHFQLYQGYVKNTNQLLSRLKDLESQDKEQTPDYGALKRRLNWEFDGMRLHELYFENLGGKDPLEKSSELYLKILKDFGSYEAWKKSFVATGMMRGIGWTILYRDRQSGRLFNVWVEEHDIGNPVGADPLLVMDAFEHAYITQFGLDKAKYIAVFFDHIAWEKVSQRYAASLGPAAPAQ